MVYQYKIPGLYPVPAQDAGEELDRIYREKGDLQARDVVEESRPETAVLHPYFEWDDWKAAEKWRERQARGLIQCVVTVQESAKTGPVEVRAYVHVEDSYRPTQVVLSEKDMKAQLIEDFRREAAVFQRRLETFSSLRPAKQLSKAVYRAINDLRQEERP